MDGRQGAAPPAADGSAYHLKAPPSNARLTEVGRFTPMGELLRRYWHPVGMARDAGATPRTVRILGEDLILFRDGGGRPGLVYPRCCHRGTTLYYGKVEDRGIRCCYHGWLFSADGRCLEQPCEPEGGKFREKVLFFHRQIRCACASRNRSEMVKPNPGFSGIAIIPSLASTVSSTRSWIIGLAPSEYSMVKEAGEAAQTCRPA